jgi:hypothetical protein
VVAVVTVTDYKAILNLLQGPLPKTLLAAETVVEAVTAEVEAQLLVAVAFSVTVVVVALGVLLELPT